MKLKKLTFVIYFFGIILLFDFVITNLLKKKIDFYNKLYPDLSHRISNNYFHHSFELNVNTIDIWGSKQYSFVTNSLGFKDGKNRIIKSAKGDSKRLLIIGDSFTEGIGFEYKDTFVGILDNNLSKKNIEVYNAGVASQSPIIYLSKIIYLIEELKFEFDELLVLLDISDIPDETYYNQKNNKLIIINNGKNISQKLGELLLKNFSSVILYDTIVHKLDIIKRNIEKRYQASKEFNKSFFKITVNEIDIYKAIKVKRGNWTHQNEYWKQYGKKGRDLATSNLLELLKKCRKHGIQFSLAVYPWPSQIYYDLNSLKHRKYWQEWSKRNNVKYYDLFKNFESDNKVNVIKKYFIKGDIHWNKKGHQYISDILLKEYLN